MKYLGSSLILFSFMGFATQQAMAADNWFSADAFNVTGNVTLATDYRFRGLSQTSNNPSVQGGLTLAHQSGFYINLWASNVDLGLDGNSIEADYFLGYQWKIDAKSTLDFQYIDVNYPGVSDKTLHPDFGEFAVIYSHNGNIKENDNITLSGYYSPDYAMKSGDEVYLNAAFSYPVYKSINLIGAVGYTKLDSVEKFQQAYGYGDKDHYMDYKVGLKTNVKGLDTELSWINTDIKNGPKITDDTVYFSIGKSF